MQTAQQLAQKHNVTFINTRTQHAHIVKNDVAIQNAVNANKYTQQQLAKAYTLQKKLAKQLNTTAYLNLRERFIAIKLKNAVSKLSTKTKMQDFIAQCKQHKAQIVFTNTSAVIVRIR